MIWWTSGSFWLLFGLPRITFWNWMFTHVFKWTISCIAIHINSLSLPISKRTMWREKEKILKEVKGFHMKGNPTFVRGNGPLRFGSRTGCWTFVFRADVETPGGRRSRRSLGLFWFPQFLCQAKLWLQDWDAKKKESFQFFWRGRMLGWDWWDNWWIWIWICHVLFFWCLMCLLPTIMMLAWREGQGSLVATLDPAKVAALFGPSPSRTSPGAVGREKHRGRVLVVEGTCS